MKIIKYILLLIALFYTEAVYSQEFTEFKDRRIELLKNLSPKSLILLKSAENKLRNGDVYYPYRQSSSFYYFTGIEEPGCYLILSPGSILYDKSENNYAREILFVPVKSELEEIWNGKGLDMESLYNDYAFETVLPQTEYAVFLENILPSVDTLFTEKFPPVINDGLSSPDTRIIQNSAPFVTALITGKINTMREIKSPSEISLIEKAADITCEAQKAIMKYIKPEMYEYEIEGLIDFTFKKNGVKRHGFLPIIGSGPNSCILHYKINDRQMKGGEVVVIDIGAEYSMYTADVTRTIPVSGEFSQRQKELYNIVLKAYNETISILKPGISKDDINNKAVEIISEGLMEIGLIQDKNEYKQYFMHGTTHHVGLDVHDVSASSVLKPGMIITIEPGIYVRQENTGIRIEDDVLITEDGYKVLSGKLPVSIEEIEKLMINQ